MECTVCFSAANLRVCSNCQNAVYCSKECQVKDWIKHSQNCVTIIENLETLTVDNEKKITIFAETTELQLGLSSLKPYEKIPREVHPTTTQFFRVEQGSGTLTVGSTVYQLVKESAAIVPAGLYHEIQAGKDGLKIYSIYSPPTTHEIK